MVAFFYPPNEQAFPHSFVVDVYRFLKSKVQIDSCSLNFSNDSSHEYYKFREQTCLFTSLVVYRNMFEVQLGGAAKINLGLVVVDMQNGFVAKDGSYDKLGMNTPLYREIIPKVRRAY